MDRDILRIVIVAVGAVVVLGMVLWSVIKSRRKDRDINFYDHGNPLDNIDDSLILKTENDDFDIVPLGSALEDDYGVDPVSSAADKPRQQETPPEKQTVQLPKLIQFSIVARADEGFNGADLQAAFDHVGLEYGSVQVFERLDANRLVDFAVASMVEPGTFPKDNLHAFDCPGIVFFMQPREVDNPLAVFEDFIQTINFLAAELDGIKWDHQRQLLTEETVQKFRSLLG